MLIELAVLGAVAIAVWAVAARKPRRSGPSRELLNQLPPELAGRYLELAAVRDRVRKTVAEHGLEAVMGDQLRHTDALVEAYLRLAQAAARYRGHLQASPPGAIERELERTRARLTDTDNPDAQATIRQNMAVLEKRLEKLQQIKEVAATLKTRLDTLEDTVHLIHEQALTASAPEDISVDFGRVMDDVASADRALAETRAYLGTGLVQASR